MCFFWVHKCVCLCVCVFFFISKNVFRTKKNPNLSCRHVMRLHYPCYKTCNKKQLVSYLQFFFVIVTPHLSYIVVGVIHFIHWFMELMKRMKPLLLTHLCKIPFLVPSWPWPHSANKCTTYTKRVVSFCLKDFAQKMPKMYGDEGMLETWGEVLNSLIVVGCNQWFFFFPLNFLI
jgi:hypothetical protein